MISVENTRKIDAAWYKVTGCSKFTFKSFSLIANASFKKGNFLAVIVQHQFSKSLTHGAVFSLAKYTFLQSVR